MAVHIHIHTIYGPLCAAVAGYFIVTEKHKIFNFWSSAEVCWFLLPWVWQHSQVNIQEGCNLCEFFLNLCFTQVLRKEWMRTL